MFAIKRQTAYTPNVQNDYSISGEAAVKLMLGFLSVISLSSCSVFSQLGMPVGPASQGSVGSCHSFVVAGMYEEKLKRAGLEDDLSEKDVFLRAFFRGQDEKQEILRQLTISTDRILPWTYREGATLDRVAEQVTKYGALSEKEEPYVSTFKAGFPMQMNQLRSARMRVNRKATALKAQLGRSLTREEKAGVVNAEYAFLQRKGVIDALRIKRGGRERVRQFAQNFSYKQASARGGSSKLSHIVKLLKQGSVGAGLENYPWASGAKRRGQSGHAVIIRDYDPEVGEFVITNPWWLRTLGVLSYDRVEATEFMRHLEIYGWLQPHSSAGRRYSGPSEVAVARLSKGSSGSAVLQAKSLVKKPKMSGFFGKWFNQEASAEKVQVQRASQPEARAPRGSTWKRVKAAVSGNPLNQWLKRKSAPEPKR